MPHTLEILEKNNLDAKFERRLGSYIGASPGPTVVAVGGMHGNEPAGVHAIRAVLATLKSQNISMSGAFHGLAGNLKALRAKTRYIDTDLNRMWSTAVIDDGERRDTSEYQELLELDSELVRIEREAGGPITLLDCHTFSGDGPPFVIADDAAIFNELLSDLPFPVIFGLTEKLDGTLNHFMQRRGNRGMAIEGGQHKDPLTVENLTLFLWLFLTKRGYIEPSDLPENINQSWTRLMGVTGHLPRKVRINYRHAIQPGSMFRMFPGFQSFGSITKGEPLATDRSGIIHAPGDGCILMPLYQGKGDDGFFIGLPE